LEQLRQGCYPAAAASANSASGGPKMRGAAGRAGEGAGVVRLVERLRAGIMRALAGLRAWPSCLGQDGVRAINSVLVPELRVRSLARCRADRHMALRLLYLTFCQLRQGLAL
jgi:hypothetical protein